MVSLATVPCACWVIRREEKAKKEERSGGGKILEMEWAEVKEIAK